MVKGFDSVRDLMFFLVLGLGYAMFSLLDIKLYLLVFSLVNKMLIKGIVFEMFSNFLYWLSDIVGRVVADDKNDNGEYCWEDKSCSKERLWDDDGAGSE